MYSNNSYTPLVYKKKIVKAFLNQRAVGGGTNTAKLHRKTHKQHTVVTEWHKKTANPIEITKKISKYYKPLGFVKRQYRSLK